MTISAAVKRSAASAVPEVSAWAIYTLALLRGRGHIVENTSEIGEAAAILADSGWLQGAADSRSEGKADGY